MNIPNPAGPLVDLARIFYTTNDKLARMEQDVREVKAETSALRTELAELKARVAVLEESRKTIEAQMRAVVAETVADLKIQYMQQQLTAGHAPALAPSQEKQD